MEMAQPTTHACRICERPLYWAPFTDQYILRKMSCSDLNSLLVTHSTSPSTQASRSSPTADCSPWPTQVSQTV